MAFQYDKLPNNGFFRVFELGPGKGSDPLQGNLRTYLRERAPKYEALSYVWGFSVQNRQMKCNDQTFMITDSLDTALRRLRLVGDSRCLWVDQICIDQTSLEERSEQVSIMRDIYSGATLVNAWLGPADAEKTSAVGMIISTLAKMRPGEFREQQYFPENEYLQELGLPARESPAWGALNSMLSGPYFSRVWILQELALAATYTLLWGDLVISKADFVAFKMATISLRMRCQDPKTLVLTWVNEDSHGRCPVLGWNTVSMAFTSGYREGILDLYWLVSSTRGCQATDPRDKIFGLLGLAGVRAYGITPDYHKAESTVFAEFALKVISEERNLEILNYTDIKEPNDKERRPLWAPRWHHKDATSRYNRSLYGFESSNTTEMRMRSSKGGQSLELKGLHIDKVKETNIQHKGLSHDIMAMGSMAIDHGCLLENQYGSDIITPIVLTMMSGRVQSTDGELCRPTNHSYLNSFTAFAFESLLVASSNKECNKKLLKATIQLIKMAVQTYLSEPQNESIFREPEVWDFIINKLDQLSLDDMETSLSYMDILKRITGDIGEGVVAFTWNIAHIHGKRFFITEKGYIGTGPCCLEPGDSVCILFGGDTPYIVRTSSPSSDEYLFLGNAYVHGIMEGEAITTWEEQKDSQGPQFQEQLFKLL
ncbi:het-6OR heterokaryon incompatibility (het-6OR allele) [Fusarium mundagurra]|uniref:Het-6OR heterokaryon incompatibility (Het-6OR allele) n=1 Tax=Fusarium mundagurra TaxID=1567541 RepID=A0A8H5Z143_9HYPO|nr:het-6OR heterokaryon incompatibility (het-6OR allele) [Fusarium mundagurra]